MAAATSQTLQSVLRQAHALAWLRGKLGRAVFYGFVLIFLFAVLAPFLWMFISSISPQVELTKRPPHWMPENPTLHRYQALFFPDTVESSVPLGARRFLSGMRNSLIVSSSTTVICLVFGTMAAYAFARIRLPGERFFMMSILGAQMLPVITIIIPLYLVMQTLRLIDTLHGLVLLYTGFLLPTVIWIMHSYFKTIPKELEEAAMIDGCSRLGALTRVILPLSGPGLVAVAAFAFLNSWNEFFMALIFTGSSAKTITVTVTEFSTQFGVDYGLMATGGFIGSLPPLILALLLQRYIVQGLTAGATKG
jgi:multiple sugar transport system permease protein